MLAILSTHPIQYQVPLWKALAQEGKVPFEVWYLSDNAARVSFDPEFQKHFAWDLDMLEGYHSQFLHVNQGGALGRFAEMRLAESLRERLERKAVKALWVQGWQVAAYWQAVWQAHSAGVSVWIRAESHDIKRRSLYREIPRRWLLSQFFRRIDYFLYIGQANRRLYQNLGIQNEKLRPAPYCVDNQRFASQASALSANRTEIRKRFGIPADAFCVLFAGKFIPKKRPLDVVAAVKRLQRAYPNRTFHILWVGSGELDSHIRNTCSVFFDAEGVSDTDVQKKPHLDRPGASFTGFLNQTEISQAYVAADCLVLPSASETWGLVVNEAMASGLPCLASDACGCAEDLVVPIHSELCFREGDIASICRGVERVMAFDRSELGLEHRVAEFDISSSVETIHTLYKDLN